MKEMSSLDWYLMLEGTHRQLFSLFGAHKSMRGQVEGVKFRLYAPHAKSVAIIGDFNNWQAENQMELVDKRGLFEQFIPDMGVFSLYKYQIETTDNRMIIKSDPFAFFSEKRPGTASIVYDLSAFPWTDEAFISKRLKQNIAAEPCNVYEVYLGGFKRSQREVYCSYEQLAHTLIPYVADNGFTHVEVMPVLEHPLDASWGYQATGYFSATHRYGNPKQLMHFVQSAHHHQLGVIFDWVPVHFGKDAHGLYCFDGAELFSYQDSFKRENNEWGTANFDLTSGFVRSFLISSALFWFEYYHFDGIRIDAVSHLIYQKGNEGLGENREGIAFIKELTRAIHEQFPGALVIAEDSSAFGGVTNKLEDGGLGFDLKWNLGWMNDTFKYMELDTLARQYNHQKLNFSYYYMENEAYLLPFSHDEVVHGKKAVIDKMSGSYEEQFRQARLLYAHMYTHPGKKLNFMGNEIGHFREFDENISLDWFLLDYEKHRVFQHYMKSLMYFYRENQALYDERHLKTSFQWLFQDQNQNLLAFFRGVGRNKLIIIHNFSGADYPHWHLGVFAGKYEEVLNTDWEQFGGHSLQNSTTISTITGSCHQQEQYIAINVPQLSTIILRKK
ncbi:MAG: 1,4-alpha-glucan branching protein GlgB [Culicoidibacterales bacterium]